MALPRLFVIQWVRMLSFKTSNWFKKTANSLVAQNHIPWWLLIYCLASSLLFTFLVPPFQKPDEVTHFYRTLSIGQGNLICPEINGVLENPLPHRLASYPSQTNIVSHPKYINRFFSQAVPQTEAGAINQSNFLPEQRLACTLPFIPYLPIGLVLAPLEWLQASPEWLFYIGRLGNAAIGFSILMLAYLLTPRKARILTVSVLLLPMTWHQVSSFGKDGLHIAFGLLSFSLVLRAFMSQSSNTIYEVFGLIFSLFITIIARPQYAPLMLVAGLITSNRRQKISFHGNSSIIIKGLGVLLITGAILISLAHNFYSVDAQKIGLTPNYEIANANTQVAFLLSYPFALVSVPYYTFIHHGRFLIEGLIGSFGSFDIMLDWIIYELVIAVIAIFTWIASKQIPRLKWWQFGILTLVILGNIYGILLAMYLYATPVGNFIVNGVQGRYFIVLLPFGLWWLADLKQRLDKKILWLFLGLIVFSVCKVLTMK